MTPRGPVRVAIVGAGLMGRWHARAVARAGGTVAVVVDADDGRAARLAGEHGADRARSLDEAAASNVADQPAFDAVHICTPLATHDALARAAIALGAHALVEKPLTSTARETDELLRLADARGVIVCPVHQFPFQRGVRRVIAALPAIGPVLHVDCVACSAGGEAGGDDARNAVAADILPHPLSLFTAVLGRPLGDVSWNVQCPAPGELRVSAASGTTTISALVSMSGRPTTNSLRVIGSRGTAHADLFHGFAVVETGAVSRSRKIVHPFALAGATLGAAAVNLSRRAFMRESAYPGLRELVAAFYAAVRGESPSPVSPGQTLDIARARDAVLGR